MRSKFEGNVADMLRREGVAFDYEPFNLEYYSKVRSGVCDECGGSTVYHKRRYLPDFWIPKHDVVVEAKGKFTSANRTKMLDVIRDWPEIEFIMWFMADNKLTKKSTTRYSDWCKKHGITYHVGLKEKPEWLTRLK